MWQWFGVSASVALNTGWTQFINHADYNIIWFKCDGPGKCHKNTYSPHLGVANGKIRDSPRRRDPCLKIREQDLKALTKSEPETLYQENRARDFILRKSEPVPKTVCSETWQWATWYSINVRSVSQEFQNVTPWRLIFDSKTRLIAPTYSKDCYRTFLIK